MTQFLRQRQSIRLKGYDYSKSGPYFVTICTQERTCLFGDIIDGQNRLNDAGRMVEWWFYELAQKFSGVQCDAFVCMPNHVHFVVNNTGHDATSPSICSSSLPKIIQWFKTMTTNAYIRGVKDSGWPAFNRRLWQRNYYEHIVRNDEKLTSIRAYIQANPLKWELDQLHPDNAGGQYG